MVASRSPSAYIAAMPSRSDQPQRGNPHKLVRRQHVFPRRSIERFAAAGGVELADLKRNRFRLASVDDVMFCADRAWNNGAEIGWMKEIEDAFQALAEEMLWTGRDTFTNAENETLAEFYGLWQERAMFRHPPTSLLKDERILGVRVTYTADELELLEKNNISAFRSDGSLAVREVTAPLIRLRCGPDQRRSRRALLGGASSGRRRVLRTRRSCERRHPPHPQSSSGAGQRQRQHHGRRGQWGQ